jgi:hypothetical protein
MQKVPNKTELNWLRDVCGWIDQPAGAALVPFVRELNVTGDQGMGRKEE